MSYQSMMEMLNTIRDNATQEYQNRVPEATRTNLDEIRFAMLDDDNVFIANEFTGTFYNKLIKSVIITKTFENPLKPFKKGKKPLGDGIEEIYVNFIKATAFDQASEDLMKRNLPDVKAVYHRRNRKDKYKITVTREILSMAFSSYDALENFVKGEIQTLYNSAELDEFIHMKQLIKSAKDKKAVVKMHISDPTTSDANGKEFIKAIKTTSGLMAFPNSDFNGYLTAQSVDDKPIITFSRKSEQVLILDTATDTSCSVDVLASLFNMSVAEFNDTKKVVIDHFPDKNIRAFLCDEMFFQVYDDLFVLKTWENPESLYMNYILHVQQTLAYSPLVNAVVFTTEAPETT